MGFLDKINIFKNFNGEGEKRHLAVSAENPSSPLYPSGSGVSGEISVNEDSVMGIPAVKRAIEIISDAIASVELDVNSVQDGHLAKDEDHYLNFLLNVKPNDYQSRDTFFGQMITSLLLHGNAFALIERDSDFNVKAFKPIHHSKVTVQVKKNGGMYYEIEGDSRKRRQPYEVIHLMGVTNTGYLGVSVLEQASELFAFAISNNESAKDILKNGLLTSGTLKTDKVLNAESAKRLKRSVDSYRAGEKNSGKILVLEEGMDFNPHQHKSLAETGYASSVETVSAEIAKLFGVPPFLLGDLSKSTMNNVYELSQAFLRYTITPLVRKIEAEITLKCLTDVELRKGDRVKGDLKQLQLSSVKDKAEYLKLAASNGIISINEAREELGMQPKEGLDNHHIQINMGVVQEIDNPITNNKDG